MGDNRDQSIMSNVPKMEIPEEETKYGDSNQLASNIVQSSQQYLIISKTEITTSGLIRAKSEPNESDRQNEIDSQISSSNKNEIDKEIEERTDSSIQCLQCQRIFKDMDGLNSHKIFIHGIPTEPFRCDQCSAIFINAEYLNQHQLKRHIRASVFTCDRCPKSFEFLDRLEQHIEMAHATPTEQEKLERRRESRNKKRKRKKAERKEKKQKQKTTNIDEEILSADHESIGVWNSHEVTTSNSAENSASTSTNMDELPIVCFLCPRRFESDQAINSHLTSYHRIERSEID